MPGTVIIPQEVVKETLIYVMLGLWNDGFRKQIIINNHGQLWVLETALHEFMYRYQLPGIFQVLDWHRAVREFFFPTGRKDSLETHFVHADEAETSVALLMFPKEMVEMGLAQDAEGESFLPEGHFDKSVEPFRRPHRWSEGEGHAAIEIASTPQGVVGKPSRGSAQKAKRPVAAILKYLTLVIDQILERFPPGEIPPVEKVTLRSAKEMEPYLKEPQSEGWRSVYGLPRAGF
jgi:creatinine amidohydrolase